jgi:KDO2-lipid IV(A) lauroyltransferase
LNPSYWAAQFVLWTLRRSPRALADSLARFYTRLLDLALPRLRRVGYRNLSMALPSADPKQTIDGVYRSIARLLMAFSRFPDIDKSNVGEWIEYDGFEHYKEAKRRGKGVLFATAHMGNWELSAYAHSLLTEPMNVIVRPLDNRAIDQVVEARRAGSGNTLIQKKDAARAIIRALNHNEAVGILIDQNSNYEQGVFVDFFGIPACANATFARIAAHTGAAVIPGFAVWSEPKRKYILKFLPLVEITGDTVADTQRIQQALEAIIREYPDQWLWIHRRWKTRPPGSPSEPATQI